MGSVAMTHPMTNPVSHISSNAPGVATNIA